MILRQLKFFGVVLFSGLLLSVLYNVVTVHGKASALHGSVILSTGEWTSSGGASGVAIPTSVNTAAEFKTFINGLLHNTAQSGDPGTDYNKYGAAFLVENMIHGKTEYSANAALVTAALNDYTKWAGYIDDYSDAGRIQWAVSRSVPAGSFNSTHLCVEGSGGYCWARATYYNNNYNNGGYDGKHFDFYTLSDPEPSTLIIFTNPNGTTFQIRRECGNVIGSAGPLQELGWNLQGRSLVTGATTIYAGQSTAFTNQLINTGASDATTAWTVQYCYDDCSVFGNITSGSATVEKGVTWGTKYIWNYTAPSDTTHYRVCTRIYYTNGAGPGTATEYAAAACATIIPLQSTCGGASVSPTLLGTTDSFTINASVNTNGGQDGAGVIDDSSNFYVNVNGPSVSRSNSNVTPVTIGGSGSTGTLSVSSGQAPTGDAGTYTISYGISGGAGSVSCSSSFTVAYRPYFKVEGGDVAAGAGFGDSCTEPTAKINSWNTNTSPYAGGSGEKGVWATGAITNFVSGLGLSSVGTGYVLSFSNTSNTGGSGYGGNFGSNAVPCMYDYYGSKSGTPPSIGGSTITELTSNTVQSGSYTAPLDGNGKFTLGNGSSDLVVGTDTPAGNGKQITIYVQGDLYIQSNIKYQSYGSTFQLPRLNVYVKGNIYINPNVTEIHGVYMAQKNGSVGGYINTCNTGNVSSSQAYSTCNKQLKVVGAMAAETQLRLMRSYGNLAATPGAPAAPAETFVYSPEMWLAQPVNGDYNYQAYTNLPPVL